MMCSTLQVIHALLLVAAGYTLAMKPLPEFSMDQRKTVIISTRDIHWRSSAYVHHKRDASDEEETTLRTSLIIVFSVGIIIGLLLMVIVSVVCMLNRAKRGIFCCLKPKIRYPQHSANLVSDSSENEEEETLPPQYDTSYLVNESPPVYQDALQDIVIAKGVRTSDTQLPPYQQNHSHSFETASRQENTPTVTVS